MNVLLILILLAFLGLVFFHSFLLVCFSISFFFQVAAQDGVGAGTGGAGGTGGTGGVDIQSDFHRAVQRGDTTTAGALLLQGATQPGMQVFNLRSQSKVTK